MRYDECMVTRPDMMDLVEDGLVPEWTKNLPVKEVLLAMDLRRRGYTMLGLDPGDDLDELFHDQPDGGE